MPKQFQRLFGERTLIQETWDRFADWIPPSRAWVLTNSQLAPETARQLPELPVDHILVEPCARNTAPCIGLAAMRLLADDPEAVMLVLPSDHVVRPVKSFSEAVHRANALIAANPERLVLLGDEPKRPATGFGYIEQGPRLDDDAPHAFAVASFREKPDLATAQAYLDQQRFLWNCGIFVWRARTIVSALERFTPLVYERLQTIADAGLVPLRADVLNREFAAMPSISIDYAVLERAAGSVVVIEAMFEWDDVGSWSSLARYLERDDSGNKYDGLFAGVRSQDCIVRSTADHLVAIVGQQNLVVVHTPTATLVAPRDDETAMRLLISELEKRGLTEFL